MPSLSPSAHAEDPERAPDSASDVEARRFRQLAELASDAIWEHDPDGSHFFISASFEDVLGYPVCNFKHVMDIFPHIHPDDQSFLQALLANADVIASRNEYRVRLKRRDGVWITIENRFIVQRDQNGTPKRFVGVLRDITAQAERERERLLSLETDPLTGLHTLKAGEKRICTSLREGVEFMHAFLFVRTVFDINADPHGFFLQHVGSVLQKLVRKDDEALRIDSNTFLVFANHYEFLDEIGDLAQSLYRLLMEVPTECSESVPPVVSIGVAIFPYDGLVFQALLQRAEAGCPAEGGVGFYDKEAAKRFQLNSKLLMDSFQRDREHLQDVMWTLMENLNTGLLVTDCSTHEILFANDQLQKLIPTCVPGNYCYKAFFGVEKPCPVCPQHPTEIELTTPTGDTAFVQIQGKTITWLDGRAMRLSIVSDVTERVLHARKLEHMAYHDPLLAVPNRQAALRALHTLFQSNMERCAILLLDVRDFKTFNERFGHTKGDRLLQAIVDTLALYIPRENLFRSGGDEFLIPLPGVDAEAAIDTAKRLLEFFKTPLHIEDFEYRCRFAIGISLYPSHGMSSGSLVTHAELALDEGKRQNTEFFVFSTELESRLSRKKRLQHLLRRALEHNDFEVYFQPIYTVTPGEFKKAEALLRLRDETGTFVSPAEFIPIAEETGLIVDIGAFVLDTVCRELRALSAEQQPLQIAVNISAIQLLQQNFVSRTLGILAAHGVDPSQLEFEVTESVLIKSFEHVRQIMDELQGHGIHFALDDFGTGYSSLSYLTHLPIRTLKLDRSFISQLEHSESNRHISRAIIELARHFGMQIVAEGVETAAQADIISAFGATCIQGFFYARPMPGQALIPWLKEQEECLRD